MADMLLAFMELRVWQKREVLNKGITSLKTECQSMAEKVPREVSYNSRPSVKEKKGQIKCRAK